MSDLERLDFSAYFRSEALRMLELGAQRLEAKRDAGTITAFEADQLARTPEFMAEVRGEPWHAEPAAADGATVSYCAECDAPPGGCEHTGNRYLPPIEYELLGGTSPRDFRWKAPDSERERLDNPQSSWPTASRVGAPAPVKPIQHLVVELEAWVELDEQLEGTLRAAYERDPQTTSRLVTTMVDMAARHELRSPAGWLVARLRKHRLT